MSGLHPCPNLCMRYIASSQTPPQVRYGRLGLWQNEQTVVVSVRVCYCNV